MLHSCLTAKYHYKQERRKHYVLEQELQSHTESDESPCESVQPEQRKLSGCKEQQVQPDEPEQQSLLQFQVRQLELVEVKVRAGA